MRRIHKFQKLMSIKVVIVEDLVEVAEGLAAFIALDNDIELMATYASAELAEKALPQLLPDVVIMDINLPGMTGIECVKKNKTHCSFHTVYDVYCS
jgi:YesN/AraC family two-component response regulator